MSRSISQVRMWKWKLSWQDVRVLGRMVVLLVVVVLARRRWSLPDIVERFDAEGQPGTAPISPDRLFQLCRGVLRRSHRTDYCMLQALVLFYFMRRWGWPAQIRFGVAREDSVLVGHAWVELYGTPFREKEDPRDRYATTFAYPQEPQPTQEFL